MVAWYATGLEFQATLMGDIENYDEHAGLISTTLNITPRGRIWTIHHAGLNVPGRPDAVAVRVELHESPTYDTYGLEPYDFPVVFADPGVESKHRHEGDALCLWFPGDAADRRWHHTDGLLALFNLVRNHLFYEAYWRATGGHGGEGQAEGTWLGDEAAHGYLAALAEVS